MSNLKLKEETNQISEGQYNRILNTIKKIKNSPIGNKNINSITSNEIQLFLNSFKNLSNSTIEKIHQQLNQGFKIAINKGYIVQNPMIDVIRPKSDKEDKDVRALTVEEQQEFTNWLIINPLINLSIEMFFLFKCI